MKQNRPLAGNLRVAEAVGIPDLDTAARVRYRVFVESEGVMPAASYPGGREIDSYDTLPETTNFVGWLADRPICTVRLIRAIDSEGRPLALPFEASFTLLTRLNRACLAEVPRSSVVPEYQGKGIIVQLYEYVYKYCRRQGLTALLAVAACETDSEEDASLLYQRIRDDEFTHDTIRAQPRRSTPAPENPARRLRRRLDGTVAYGGQLRLFLRIGARVIGPPCFVQSYGRFCIPIAIELHDSHFFEQSATGL